jgi:hypothetical protein
MSVDTCSPVASARATSADIHSFTDKVFVFSSTSIDPFVDTRSRRRNAFVIIQFHSCCAFVAVPSGLFLHRFALCNSTALKTSSRRDCAHFSRVVSTTRQCYDGQLCCPRRSRLLLSVSLGARV